MESNIPKHIAIIGAGLGVGFSPALQKNFTLTKAQGLGLALSLHSRSIPCKVFDFRDPTMKQAGGIMLTPNSLPLLESWGVYKRIRTRGFNFDAIIAKNDLNQT